jgi:hypothetical protein
MITHIILLAVEEPCRVDLLVCQMVVLGLRVGCNSFI